MRKSPKNLPEGAPLWVLPKGDASLPLRRCRNPLDRVSATNLARFATLSWWANRSLFLSKLHRGSHSLFSIRGSAGMAPRMPRAFLPSTNTARAEGRGIKGGYAPFAGGPGTRRSLVSLCLLSSHKKVGRGAGRSARSRGLWGRSPPQKSPGCSHPPHGRENKKGSAEGPHLRCAHRKRKEILR